MKYLFSALETHPPPTLVPPSASLAMRVSVMEDGALGGGDVRGQVGSQGLWARRMLAVGCQGHNSVTRVLFVGLACQGPRWALSHGIPG